jgi:hypothetical protein
MNIKQQQPKTTSQQNNEHPATYNTDTYPKNYQPVIPKHYTTAYNNIQQKRTGINENCPHDVIAKYKDHTQCLQCKKICSR